MTNFVPEIQDLFVRVEYLEIEDEHRLVGYFDFAFPRDTRIEVAKKQAAKFAKFEIEDDAEVVAVTIYYATPRLVSWEDTTSLVLEVATKLFERDGFTAYLNQSEILADPYIDSFYIQASDGTVLSASPLSPDGSIQDYSENWWRWQFNKFVDAELHRLGQLSLLPDAE